MSFVVAVSRVVRATPAVSWAALADFPSWKQFMPRSFSPMWGPDRALRAGDRLIVRVAGSPMVLRVSEADPGRVIAWRGGAPGVLAANHRFFFDDAPEGRTTVRSEETWSGLVTHAGLVERQIRKAADRIGQEQLDGLVRRVEG